MSTPAAIASWGVMATAALVVEGVPSGRVPSTEDVTALLADR